MVGHRDRPQPLLARARQQHLHGRRAVVGMVGVHVQVDLDQRSLGQALRQRRVPVRRVPARGQCAVDRFELIRGAVLVAHQAVVAREVVGHQLGGRRQAGRARVQAAEEALDEAARHQRREQPLGGRVERADVERARVAQRGVGGARRERLVHVHEVERRPSLSSSSTVRATSIGSADGRRRALPARPDPEDRAPRRRRSRAALPDRFPRAGIARSARAARSALREARTRSCERDGASTSTRWPRRESSAVTRFTWALTSLSSASHGYGVTWAIENEAAICSTIIPPAGRRVAPKRRATSRPAS